MTGTLFVVATPIGNLEDITLRALRVLREAAVVAAEDTRRSGNLLRHFQITTPLLSLHAHNESERIPEIVARLQRGQSVALVSDAGTPGISDPGARLVRAARAAGLRVEPVPGPSAVAAVLSASGWDASRFVFAGFVPIRSKDRERWFEWVRSYQGDPVVFFEAPHRIEATLRDIAVKLGERPILLAREVTKLHESWLMGTASEVSASLGTVQGEYVGVLGPVDEPRRPNAEPTDAEVAAVFGQITNNAVASRRDAIKAVAERLGLSPRAVFSALERHKHSGE